MKCQILFSGKNKKNNIILSSAENAQRVVKVKGSSWAEVGGIHEKYVNKKIVKNINFSEKASSL